MTHRMYNCGLKMKKKSKNRIQFERNRIFTHVNMYIKYYEFKTKPAVELLSWVQHFLEHADLLGLKWHKSHLLTNKQTDKQSWFLPLRLE